MTTDLVLTPLRQALHDRGQQPLDGLVHHSDAGSQYLSIAYGETLAGAEIAPSVGSVGDSYDNALAETIIGLFKSEVIEFGKPWRTLDDVELATFEWVDWFNHHRLFGPLGYVPPAEAETAFYPDNPVARIPARLTRSQCMNPARFGGAS